MLPQRVQKKVNISDVRHSLLKGLTSNVSEQLVGNAVGAIGDKVSTNSWGVTLGAFPVKDFVGQVVNQGIANSVDRKSFLGGLFSSTNQWGETTSLWGDLTGIGNAFTLFPEQ